MQIIKTFSIWTLKKKYQREEVEQKKGGRIDEIAPI